jgi:hypothetical protein
MTYSGRTSASPANVFRLYAAQLREAMAEVGRSRPADAGFEPAFELPPDSPELDAYFAAADVRFAELGTAGRSRLVLLDLMSNPGTKTVKTLASLVIVARAAHHIATTGEPVMILTPSSANKATALRDAVLRAYTYGLATPDELRIVTLVPDVARPKLWSSQLSDDPVLAAVNPMCVLGRGQAEHVKSIAKKVLDSATDEVYERTGFRLWHTLDLANYRCADAVRAFVEQTALPATPGRTRTHVHSVSSAFGLLGHHFGTTLLADPAPAAYFLVQHLSTPDMVVSLHDLRPPAYRYDAATGLHHQDAEPRYPATTFDPAENLETTFYTRMPATSPAMNAIIREQGGGGIVVSLHECLTRYAQVRALLAEGGVDLPADPRTLREWSLVMAATGTLAAVERGLLDADEIVLHGTGSYGAEDYTPIADSVLRRVHDATALRRVILEAATLEAGTAAARRVA